MRKPSEIEKLVYKKLIVSPSEYDLISYKNHIKKITFDKNAYNYLIVKLKIARHSSLI